MQRLVVGKNRDIASKKEKKKDAKKEEKKKKIKNYADPVLSAIEANLCSSIVLTIY